MHTNPDSSPRNRPLRMLTTCKPRTVTRQPEVRQAAPSTRSHLPLPEQPRFDVRALVGDACIFGGLLMWVFLLLGSMR